MYYVCVHLGKMPVSVSFYYKLRCKSAIFISLFSVGVTSQYAAYFYLFFTFLGIQSLCHEQSKTSAIISVDIVSLSYLCPIFGYDSKHTFQYSCFIFCIFHVLYHSFCEELVERLLIPTVFIFIYRFAAMSRSLS